MSKLNDLPLVYKTFAAEPYTPNIGATIHGLDLSKPLSDVAKTELQDALAQYEVLFFRDQNIMGCCRFRRHRLKLLKLPRTVSD